MLRAWLSALVLRSSRPSQHNLCLAKYERLDGHTPKKFLRAHARRCGDLTGCRREDIDEEIVLPDATTALVAHSNLLCPVPTSPCCVLLPRFQTAMLKAER